MKGMKERERKRGRRGEIVKPKSRTQWLTIRARAGCLPTLPTTIYAVSGFVSFFWVWSLALTCDGIFNSSHKVRERESERERETEHKDGDALYIKIHVIALLHIGN